MTTTVERPVNGAKFTPAPVPAELAALFDDEKPPVDEPVEAAAEAGPSRLAARWSRVRADWAAWWLRTVDPPALDRWWQGRIPHRVPDDNDRLRAAWRIDFAVTGSLLAGLSVLLFLTAAGCRWVACHPARRWTFIALLVATAAFWLA